MGFAFMIGAVLVSFVGLSSLPALVDWWRDRRNRDAHDDLEWR